MIYLRICDTQHFSVTGCQGFKKTKNLEHSVGLLLFSILLMLAKPDIVLFHLDRSLRTDFDSVTQAGGNKG